MIAMRLLGLLWAALLFSTLSHGATPPGATFKPLIEPYGQVFPALELAIRDLRMPPARDPKIKGLARGLIGVSLKAPADGERVRVQLTSPGVIKSADYTAVLERRGRAYEIYPPIVWDWQQLLAQARNQKVPISMQVNIGNSAPLVQTGSLTIRPLNEALYWVEGDRNESPTNLNWIFAAYVDENDAEVARILEEAREQLALDGFVGYASDDPHVASKQVFAIWLALKARGLRYSNRVQAGLAHPKLRSQYVRFVRQSLREHQANCMDGSILFASLLMRAGLRPYLVLVPEHAFLAYATDAAGTQLEYLETSMLDQENASNRSLSELAASLPDLPDIQIEFESFEAAIEAARTQVEIAAGAFDDSTQGDYQIIDIRAARQRGVRSINVGSRSTP
jgi:hypothetical protein